MTQHKNLEEKLRQLPTDFREQLRLDLEDRGWESGGMHSSSTVQDVAYAETPKYEVVAARWKQLSWVRGFCVTQGTDWVEVYVREKGAADNGVRKIQLEWIVTRDPFDAWRDRRELWGLDRVSIEPVNDHEIMVAWTNEKGQRGPTYRIDLRDEKQKGSYCQGGKKNYDQ